MRERFVYYDDFVKSVSNGLREFETEEDLIDCFEYYIAKSHKWIVENSGNPIEYVYMVTYETNPLIVIYVENPADAMYYEDQNNTLVYFIRTCKHSDIYRMAYTNSVRKAIEHFLDLMNLKFMIGGELRRIEYFGKPLEFRDNDNE